MTVENTVNVGQPRADFKVAIAGSNGYVTKKISTPAGYNTGVYYGKNAINAPYDAQGYNTFMGSKIFTEIWNVDQCAAYCKSQSEYNIATAPKDGTPAKVCRFFNTYLLTAKMANGEIKPQGQYCSLYTEAWPEKYATNGGQWRGKDQYTIDYSFGYAKTDAGINPLVGDAIGAKFQAVADIKWSSLQPFCSTYLGYKAPVATVTTTTTVIPVSTSTISSTTTVLPNGKRDSTLIIPAGLAKYQPAIISAACAMQANLVLSTSTLTQSATVTGVAVTTTVSAISTVTGSPVFNPADNLAESAYIVLEGGTFNAAGAGYAEFQGGSSSLFVGMRDTPAYVSLTRSAKIAVDPVTGYLKDLSSDHIAYFRVFEYIRGAGGPIYFFSQGTYEYLQPLICAVPPSSGPYTLSCSVTTPDGLVISHLMGLERFESGHGNYAYMSMADVPASEIAPGSRGGYRDATITIFNR
jgi:hypothetical protein